MHILFWIMTGSDSKLSRTWLIGLAISGLLIVAFALLALVLYTRTERGVLEKHSQDQQVLAQVAASVLAERVDSLLFAAQSLSERLQRASVASWEQEIATLPPLVPGGKVLLLRSDSGFVWTGKLPGEAGWESALTLWQGKSHAVLTNPRVDPSGQAQVVLLVPLYRGEALAAQVGFTLPFAHLTDSILPPSAAVRVSLSLLDEQGLVLANSRHPEMVGRRLPEPQGNCLPCHADFSLEHRMLRNESGVGSVRVANEPLALVSFTAVHLPGRRWSLALTEPYSSVIADTRHGFQAITLLLGLVLMVGIGATTLTLQYRLQRRRAEERAHLAERRAALEQQLRQSQQLATIGKMTSQIAHQINTPLATLALNVEYLRAELARTYGGASAGLGEVSNAILEEIERLKRVVNDYLRFSRLPQAVLARESLTELLRSFLDFIEPEARQRNVRVEADLGTEAMEAELDAELFRQAFLNLVRNSFEAMPEGGTLRIRIARQDTEVAVRLEDTGRGISPEALPHIFEPFFTTKKDGTGLGLAHTLRVIEQHGGTIRCDSRPGQGTAFEIRLPAASAAVELSRELAGKGR